MTRAWLVVPLAVLWIPFACGEDETTSNAATTTGPGPTTNASTAATTTSGGGMTGGGGETGAGGNGQGGAGQGGGSGESCEMCADRVENGACMGEFEACMPGQQTDCETWYDCYTDECMDPQQNNFTEACFTQCDMDNDFANLPDAQALKTCLCAECGGECNPACP